jgi:hypothetical protein
MTSTLAAACVELLQLSGASLYFELSARDDGRPFAQCALQILDLEEGLDVLALSSLGQVPGKAQDLVAVGVLFRLLPGRLPPDRFPRVPLRRHVLERSALPGGFDPSEQGKTSRAKNDRRSDPMPSKRANVKNEKQYEALKEKGMSKERAAKIANSPGASSRGGKKSHSGSSGSSSQGGTTAQKKAAGRKGGKATARKS